MLLLAEHSKENGNIMEFDLTTNLLKGPQG
jgi:hypothetical protein